MRYVTASRCACAMLSCIPVGIECREDPGATGLPTSIPGQRRHCKREHGALPGRTETTGRHGSKSRQPTFARNARDAQANQLSSAYGSTNQRPGRSLLMLEIATQFEELLAPLDVGCVTADARRAMARRVPGGEHHTTERSLLSPRQERPVFLTGEAVSEVAAEASNRTAVSGKTRSCPSAILVTRYCGTPLSDSGRSRTIRNGPGRIAAPLTDRVCPT